MKVIWMKVGDINVNPKRKPSAQAIKLLLHLLQKHGIKVRVVVRKKGKMLIAGLKEFQAAKLRGDLKIEVAEIDSDEADSALIELLFDGLPEELAEKYKVFKTLMEDFNIKKGGKSAHLRIEESDDEQSLAEYAAKIAGTNRTYLYATILIGDHDPTLLDAIDNSNGELQLLDVAAAVRIEKKKQERGKSGKKRKETHPNAHAKVRITKFGEEQVTLREVLVAKLIEFLSRLRHSDEIPSGCTVVSKYDEVGAIEYYSIAVATDLGDYAIFIRPNDTDPSESTKAITG